MERYAHKNVLAKAHKINGQNSTSMEYLANHIGIPYEEWQYQPQKVAGRLISTYFNGTLINGVYRGFIHPQCCYHGLEYIPHSWILLADSNVCDPIRWVFHQTAPRIFIGKSDDYDADGVLTRSKMDDPPPFYDQMTIHPKLIMSDRLKAKLKYMLLGSNHINLPQLCWLCERSPLLFGEYADEFAEVVFFAGYEHLFNPAWKPYLV